MKPLPREFQHDGTNFVSAYELYLFAGFPKKDWTKWCRICILECKDIIENEDYFRLELTLSEKEDNVKQNFAVADCLKEFLFSIPHPDQARNLKILHPGLKMPSIANSATESIISNLTRYDDDLSF